MSFDDAPISKMYFPWSNIILLFLLSQNHKSAQSIFMDTVFVCPAAIVILWNPFSLLIGLSSDAGLSGVLTYTCTTSSPSTVPVFFTSTLTAILSFGVIALLLTLKLLYSNVVYESPYPNSYETSLVKYQ